MAGPAVDQVEVVTADASLTDHYLGMVPADLVLICGLFGNIADEDIERTVNSCSQLCRTGGTSGVFGPATVPIPTGCR